MPREIAAIYRDGRGGTSSHVAWGDNVRLWLRGVEDEDVVPGFVLTSLLQPIRTVASV